MTYPENGSLVHDGGSISRNDSTNVQTPSHLLQLNNRQSQTDSPQETNTSSQTDIASSSPRVQSSQTDITERRGVGVQVSVPPAIKPRVQSSSAQTKLTGPPPRIK